MIGREERGGNCLPVEPAASRPIGRLVVRLDALLSGRLVGDLSGLLVGRLVDLPANTLIGL